MECSATCFLLSSCVSILCGVICLRYRACSKYTHILLFFIVGFSYRLLFFIIVCELQRQINNGYIGDINHKMCTNMDFEYSIMHGTVILVFMLLIFNENSFISRKMKRPYIYQYVSVVILVTCFGLKILFCDFENKLYKYQFRLDIDRTGYNEQMFFECPRNTAHGSRHVISYSLFIHVPFLLVVCLHCVWKGRCKGRICLIN